MEVMVSMPRLCTLVRLNWVRRLVLKVIASGESLVALFSQYRSTYIDRDNENIRAYVVVAAYHVWIATRQVAWVARLCA